MQWPFSSERLCLQRGDLKAEVGRFLTCYPETVLLSEDSTYGFHLESCISHTESILSWIQCPILTDKIFSPYKQDVVVKIGIGTIDIEGDVAYKSYPLALDTGSDLIWIQCEECKIQDENHRCYPQKEQPFTDSKSRTYQPLPSSHLLCKYSRSNEKGHCIYTVNGTEAVKGIVFGCGYKNYDDDGNAGDAYQIAGTFGMSPGPRSFLSQYKAKKFSFCMVPRYMKNPPSTYLRFGSEVKPLTRFQTVDLLMTRATKNHFVLQLEDLGVNGKRLRIDRRKLRDQQLVVDFGSTDSFMLNGAHEKLVNKLDSILITRNWGL
ncbi:aspartic proteinase nepenthesin-1-like [Arachis stenosperma]|uniref:aspartic proteinase nepenthesin-1-like n=1 Tax=Arachis stenosperma TaxID=217475 RepID=UPI0025AC9AAA|nr:aspartic proteinase nepenthesin-1-like [Arachis stenosperma]